MDTSKDIPSMTKTGAFPGIRKSTSLNNFSELSTSCLSDSEIDADSEEWAVGPVANHSAAWRLGIYKLTGKDEQNTGRNVRQQ